MPAATANATPAKTTKLPYSPPCTPNPVQLPAPVKGCLMSRLEMGAVKRDPSPRVRLSMPKRVVLSSGWSPAASRMMDESASKSLVSVLASGDRRGHSWSTLTERGPPSRSEPQQEREDEQWSQGGRGEPPDEQDREGGAQHRDGPERVGRHPVREDPERQSRNDGRGVDAREHG